MSGDWKKGAERDLEPFEDDEDIADALPGRSNEGNALQRFWGKIEPHTRWMRGRPWPVYAGLGVVCVMGVALASSHSLRANLQGALPLRVIGISDALPDGGTTRVSANGQRVALNEMRGGTAPRIETAGGRNDYLPEGQQATSGTVITVPVSQGRLMRFDEAVESVFIADPELADVRVVSADLVYVYGKTPGITNMMAVSARPTGKSGTEQQVVASALLRVVLDNRPAKEAQQEWAPSAPVDISVFGRRTAIRGQVANVDQAVDAANIAETYSPKDQPPLNKTTLEGPNQINIRVRFAEASRTDLRSFGIDWSVGGGGGSFSFGVAKDGGVKSGGAKNGTLGIKASAGKFDIDLLIEALQASGALSILAEPNLTAVTGETASFLAGGEVPIPVPTGNNGDSVTVQYKPFGVSLSFTPTMVKENRIAMRVKPEVSSLAESTSFGVQGFNLPSFTVRRAETTVEMGSGQTFAMAGLFQRDVTRNVDKMPLLGDVPVLGELFRSERYKRNETELVILITPYLVEPVSDKSLATPLDRAGNSPWQANIVGDPTDKGKGAASSGKQSGFIMK